MSKVAYVVVGDYGYEGLSIESVWLNEELAKAEAARLNGPDHDECGDDPDNCLCRFKVRRYPVGAPS